MKKRELRSRFMGYSTALVMLLCFPSFDESFGESQEIARLTESAVKVCDAVRKGDFKALLSMATQGRVTVALRRADWIDFKKDRLPNADKNLTLDDLANHVWEERAVTFDPKVKEELHTLHTALARFRHNIAHASGRLTVALSQKDAWGLRELGPSASGHVASDAFWYIYFRRENGDWKIWKFEYTVH